MRTIKTEIFGKERKISSCTDIDGCFFLDKSDDMYNTGIYCGLSLHQWTNPAYLQRISAGNMEQCYRNYVTEITQGVSKMIQTKYTCPTCKKTFWVDSKDIDPEGLRCPFDCGYYAHITILEEIKAEVF